MPACFLCKTFFSMFQALILHLDYYWLSEGECLNFDFVCDDTSASILNSVQCLLEIGRLLQIL